MKAFVFVTMRRDVLEPQGRAVMRSLNNLGYDTISNVRIGKFIEVELDGVSREEAEGILDEVCRKLLANPVIEDYRFEILED